MTLTQALLLLLLVTEIVWLFVMVFGSWRDADSKRLEDLRRMRDALAADRRRMRSERTAIPPPPPEE